MRTCARGAWPLTRDGAFWFRSTDLGDDKDRVLRKSNGDTTYFASDIAYHDNKFKRGFDLVVDIWGADHHGYVPRMQAAVEALGKKGGLEVILVQLVNLLRGGEQIAMSTRAGEFETLEDVVDEVGADAARYIFLSRKSDSKLDFDLELVKQKSMDNPVYYVQYAHARIHSVLRKGADMDVLPAPMESCFLDELTTDEDMEILRILETLPGHGAGRRGNAQPARGQQLSPGTCLNSSQILYYPSRSLLRERTLPGPAAAHAVRGPGSKKRPGPARRKRAGKHVVPQGRNKERK